LEAKVTIYFHPSCATSHEVIRGLMKAGRLHEVRLLRINSLGAVNLGVLSVPWIVVNGVPAATDPVTSDDVIQLLDGIKVDPGDVREAFMNAVLHSSLASAVAVLHGSIEPVITRGLVNAAVRGPASGVSVDEAVNRIRQAALELFEGWRDKLRRALAVSFVRELYWASDGSITADDLRQLSRPEVVGLWLLGKGSLGRAALPFNPRGSAAEDLEAMAKFVARTASGLLEKVREEQEGIYSDKEYMNVVKSAPEAA
jgi:predicted thioredoxin/glutaredoxin